MGRAKLSLAPRIGRIISKIYLWRIVRSGRSFHKLCSVPSEGSLRAGVSRLPVFETGVWMLFFAVQPVSRRSDPGATRDPRGAKLMLGRIITSGDARRICVVLWPFAASA